MNTETLQRLQQTELGILTEIDRFCRSHGIQYSLYAGTALGAARHAGFIPWDDDLDIAMTRENFNKFCAEWRKHPIEGYCLQNAEMDITCGINHTKIRKDGTLFLAEGEVPGEKHAGIWIDIFVWDKVPDGAFARLYLYWNAMRSFVFTRGFTFNSKEKWVRSLPKRILRLIPRSCCERQMRRVTRNLQRYAHLQHNYTWMAFAGMKDILRGIRYPAGIAESYTEVSFEGIPVMVFAEYRKTLEILYGDYRQLPPPEQRVCAHSPAAIRFE